MAYFQVTTNKFSCTKKDKPSIKERALEEL